jgi:hypothetical protein
MGQKTLKQGKNPESGSTANSISQNFKTNGEIVPLPTHVWNESY